VGQVQAISPAEEGVAELAVVDEEDASSASWALKREEVEPEVSKSGSLN
jgi:hypothetical protein